ncbi:MAG: alanine racemase [Candidatus Planktophila sp.]|jgi:alanine racemase
MSDRAEFLVDLSALTSNISRIKKDCTVDVLAVVKADAYGHGLIRVAQAALRAGASWLGVALLEEAITLRENGVEAPILAWLVSPGSDFDSAISHNIDLGVSSLKGLREISESAKRVGKKARIHIEIDTGMTRGGFLDEWKEMLSQDFANFDVVGIFSHFARADEPGEKQNEEQLHNFKQMVQELQSIGIDPAIKHLANSAATIKDKDSYFTMVRVGIAMYGLSPDISHLGTSKDLGLRPIGQLRAKLHLVKSVPAHSPVGYGASAMTQSDTKLGVIAMGYADGIPRIAQGSGVFVKGKKAPIIGRVSMDQFVVDLGSDSTAQTGDWVIVFGDGSHGEYTADDWGRASSSINYEIVTRIGPRVPRIYQPHEY